MSKSKELLDSLENITERKTSPFQREAFDSYTNRYYPNSIHPLPSRYDNAKKFKDADGEEYVMIDRVYGGLYSKELRQADGTAARRKMYLDGSENGSGRWFLVAVEVNALVSCPFDELKQPTACMWMLLPLCGTRTGSGQLTLPILYD